MELDAGTPAPGEFHLGGIGVQVDVPTATSGDDPPAIGLQLKSLQLPGGQAQGLRPQPRLGRPARGHGRRARPRAGAGPGARPTPGRCTRSPRLLGLADDLPPLPVDQLLSVGVPALTAWLDGVLSNPTSRGGLARARSPACSPARRVQRRRRRASRSASRPATSGCARSPGRRGTCRVVPSLDLEIGGSGAQVQATVDLFRTDLGSGATQALPRLGCGPTSAATTAAAEPLALDVPAVGQTPAVQVEAVRVGVQLDERAAGRRSCWPRTG